MYQTSVLMRSERLSDLELREILISLNFLKNE